MTPKAPPFDILQRYLDNTCTDSERALVDDWYKDLHLNSTESFSESDKEHLFERLQGQIFDQDARPMPGVFPLRKLWLYAGGIAALLAVCFGLFYISRENASIVSNTSVPREEMIVFTNSEKKMITYNLPDHTEIWLHPGARISYSHTFSKDRLREVIFEGEAFFKVRRDTTRPFVIHSGALTTEVLGTSFNVTANANEPNYRVSVVTGSVSVSTSGKGKQPNRMILKPSQQVIFEKSTSHMTLALVDDKRPLKENWQPVSLSFANASLGHIVEQLQKTFKIHIRFDDPTLKNCSLKADFNNQNLPEILEMINTLMGTTYEMEGDNVVISGEGCDPSESK